MKVIPLDSLLEVILSFQKQYKLKLFDQISIIQEIYSRL